MLSVCGFSGLLAEAWGFLAPAAAVAEEVALRVTAADNRVQAASLLPKELWGLQGPQRQL